MSLGTDTTPPTPPEPGWRPTGPDEIHQPGGKFRLNQTTGIPEVYDPEPATDALEQPAPHGRGDDATIHEPVVVTFFPNVGAATKREEAISLQDLADRIDSTNAPSKRELPLLKLATFGDLRTDQNSLRHNANVETITGIEADYDGERVAFDDAVAIFREHGVSAILYPSPSHTEDAHRWRALCPLSQARPPAQRDRYMARLNGLFRGIFSPESWTLSQSYYYGFVNHNQSHRVELIEGTPIDLMDELDADAIGKPATKTAGDGQGKERPISSGGRANPFISDLRVQRFVQKVLENLRQKATPGQKHFMLRDTALILGGIQWAARFTDDEATQWLISNLPANEIGDLNNARTTARWGLLHGRLRPVPLEDRQRPIDGRNGSPREPPRSSEEPDEQPDWDKPPPSPIDPDNPLGVWSAAAVDYANQPPRGWLLGNVFCRQFLSSLIADGGVGKTAVRIAQALSVASGTNLTGEHVHHRARVLILCFEDGVAELNRRMSAALLHHNINPTSLDGWLYLGAPKGIKLAEMKEGSPAVGKLEEYLRTTITKLKIDLTILDPYIKTHGLTENDNNAMDFTMDLFATMAIDLDAAIDLPHHTNKGVASTPGDANRGRGGTAMKDAARLVSTLTPMTPGEAEAFDQPEADRRSLIRMDSAKVNIAPPSREATWFRLVGVKLGNGTKLYPRGDEVQTVERWYPPDLWTGTDTITLNAILTHIDGAVGLAAGCRYTSEPKATTRAAWPVVCNHFPTKNEVQAKAMLTAWIKSGTLYQKSYKDPVDYKSRKGLYVAAALRPS